MKNTGKQNYISPQTLGLYLVMFVGLVFAFNAGNLVSEEQYSLLAAVFGALISCLIYFGLRSNLYLLIPVCWSLTGGIGALPLPFSLRQIVIIFSCGLFISGFIFKGVRAKASFEGIDVWIWINILYLATVFFRNPVGFSVFSGDRVGGKPYIDVTLAVMAYLILSRFKISASRSKQLPYWMLASVFVASVAGAIGTFFPDVGVRLGAIYDGFNPTTVGESMHSEVITGETRLAFLQSLGTNLVLIIISKINPLNLFMLANFGSLLIYFSGLIMILLSGFRNALMSSLLYTSAAIIIRERFNGFIKISIFGSILLSLIFAASYSPFKLPFTFQRAFSFLPGDWDQDAVNDAKGSSDWRYEMWKMVLSTDKYIKNKTLGDGFGFRRNDYEIMVDAQNGLGSGFFGEAQQEAFMINGDFHSGPVSSIRFVGYVGLALFLPLIFIMAKAGFQLIMKARGTPFQFCAFYLGIPILTYPFFFIFLFGDYRGDLIAVLFNVGMMKMLSASLSDYKTASQQSKVSNLETFISA